MLIRAEQLSDNTRLLIPLGDTMLRKALAEFVFLVCLTVLFTGVSPGSPAIGDRNIARSQLVVACRVMETFADVRLGVTAVLFHQQNKDEGPRLGELLSNHSGETMEIESAGGHRHLVTVFRVRSCFGRGVFLLPIEFKLQARDEFVLRFTQNP